ncbi:MULTISPECIES: diaminopimelate decarboxylase [Bacteroidales]|uniref:diaminopimelate decarboxylase n=1 Tax=Bacteroidales TaxID=171549 RepID=UPI00033D745A|nr:MULTISPECIES: diaminopimelate decarboxylase [Bacteroidales]CCY36061.1 diaminopimelate decarboxylase [Tannerella sp. CAG:118]
MKGTFPIEKFSHLSTPFYYYDTQLLRDTLFEINKEAGRHNFHVHYAVKANANNRILSIIRENGLGADCVSGGEIKAALKAGFPADKIVFAGVGKADWEINLGLDAGIFCFNVESVPELDVINELSAAKNMVAPIALRVNPNIDAHTHHYITTGLNENKFGISLSHLDQVLDHLSELKNIRLLGLHFHIGSQITDMDAFKSLCIRINEIQEHLYQRMLIVDIINVGGGLGVDYENPDRNSIPDFHHYFETFYKHLKLRPKQKLHFELGRAVVCQSGSLITKVLYVKEGVNKKFVIVDAGMTDLIRPALYQAYHKIENITSDKIEEEYDVVGPICESSDCFGKIVSLNQTQRGDIIALRSAGAYGEIMASQYNCRSLPKAYYSDDL